MQLCKSHVIGGEPIATNRGTNPDSNEEANNTLLNLSRNQDLLLARAANLLCPWNGANKGIVNGWRDYLMIFLLLKNKTEVSF